MNNIFPCIISYPKPVFSCSTYKHILRVIVCIVIVASLAGCSGITSVRPASEEPEHQKGFPSSQDASMVEHKRWLLAQLPQAEHLIQDILLALHDYPDKETCSPDTTAVGCNKLLGFLGQRMSPHELRQLPEGFGRGRFALVDGDTAYLFRITDWTFSGIANVANGLYFTISDIPLKRTDGLSFAFVADGDTDATSRWTLYHRAITDNNPAALPAGEFVLTRAELDAAGVSKQIDLLSQQQREERSLARQGLVWQRRTKMAAIGICSNASDQKISQKPGGRGKRNHNRSSAPETNQADSSPVSPTTMEDALQGKAHLNCRAGTGFVVTPDGIAGEVYRLIRDKDGINPVISATAKEIPGGVMRYQYRNAQEGFDVFQQTASNGLQMYIETQKAENKLTLNLLADSGASAGSLVISGDWYLKPGYRLHGKYVSNEEFAAYFLRAYRDCVMKDSQGICKSLPNFFMSFENPLIVDEFMQYVSDHYVSDAQGIVVK